MRCVLGLLAGCGIVMLVACSRTEPPESGGPVTAGTEPVMEEKTGVAVGQKAPSFRLKDQTGTERSLDEFLKQGKVALVFYRSADW